MSSRNLILCVHGRTSRAEIEAAFGILTGDAPWIHREGVLWHEPSHTDLLFITLNKSEALFSPTGQRYIHHEERGSRVLLFVREHRREGGRAGGVTEPFRCLGFARYESHVAEGFCAAVGERILFVHQWRSAGGWSGRSRRGGCRGWGWRFENGQTGTTTDRPHDLPHPPAGNRRGLGRELP